MSKPSYTASDIQSRIEKRFDDSRQFVVVREVYQGTDGYGRRLDAIVFNAYNSKNQYLEGIEVKVSKADLRKELSDPKKHAAFYENLDYFSLACPSELLTKDMMECIPPKWGLYVPDGDGLRAKRKPLALHDEIAPMIKRDFAVSLMRAVNSRSSSSQELEKKYQEGVNFQKMQQERSKPYRVKRMEEENATYKAFFESAGIDEFWGEENAKEAGLAVKVHKALDLGYVLSRFEISRSSLNQAITAIVELQQSKGGGTHE